MPKKAEKPEEKAPTFEEALTQLEELVQRMEQGELSLEESMQCYEQGVKLTAFCNGRLKEAKLKIEELRSAANGEQ